MPETLARQISALERMTTSELVDRFAELHGYPCRTRHRAYLIRKIAWRIQANAEGDLSERARRRAADALNRDGVVTDRWAVERAVRAAGGPDAVMRKDDRRGGCCSWRPATWPRAPSTPTACG